jgi:hypothetical protein
MKNPSSILKRGGDGKSAFNKGGFRGISDSIHVAADALTKITSSALMLLTLVSL